MDDEGGGQIARWMRVNGGSIGGGGGGGGGVDCVG